MEIISTDDDQVTPDYIDFPEAKLWRSVVKTMFDDANYIARKCEFYISTYGMVPEWLEVKRSDLIVESHSKCTEEICDLAELNFGKLKNQIMNILNTERLKKHGA